MAHTVLASRVYVRQADGSDKRYDHGQEIHDLTPEDLERFRAAGAIADPERVARDPAPADPPPAPPAPTPPAADTGQAPPVLDPPNADGAATVPPTPAVNDSVPRPPKASIKPILVDYAVRSGRMPQEIAEAKTVDALRAELFE